MSLGGSWCGRRGSGLASTSELWKRGREARTLAGYGLRGTRVGEARHPGPGRLACPGCRGSVRGLASGTCSICGAKNKRRGTAFRCGTCGTTLCRECCEGLSLEDIALASTPVAMEVDAGPCRPDAASMVAGEAIDVEVVPVEPAVSGGNRGSSQPVRHAVVAEAVAETQCLPCEFVGPGMLKCPWCVSLARTEAGLVNHVSTGHTGVALTGLQAQFFRGLGRGICEGCGHLRRHSDLQCSRCRVTTPAHETREGDVVTAASSGGRNGDARDVSDLLEHVAGAREGVHGDLRGGHHVRASADGVSDVGLAVGRQRRRACPALPHDFVRRCEALGSATLVHVPNPAREELCVIVCDGLEGKLDGDDNWFQRWSTRRLSCGRG